MHSVEQLVKMANQIADNLGFHDDAAARIRDHLQRFWAPSMWASVRQAEESELRPAVRAALQGLEED